MNNTWQFADSRNTLVFTTRDITEEGKPVIYVIHDRNDGAWQFYSEITTTGADARIAALDEVVFRDPSVAELSDLPVGWIAVRDSVTDPWKRRRISESSLQEGVKSIRKHSRAIKGDAEWSYFHRD